MTSPLRNRMLLILLAKVSGFLNIDHSYLSPLLTGNSMRVSIQYFIVVTFESVTYISWTVRKIEALPYFTIRLSSKMNTTHEYHFTFESAGNRDFYNVGSIFHGK